MKKLARITVMVAVVFSVLFASLSHASDKKYTLRLAETWGPNFPIFGDTTKNMAEMAEKMSNGRLKIRIDSANRHKAPFGIFDMVKSGQYDMGHSASYYWKGKDPNTLYFTSMPFGMNFFEQWGWFYYGDGMKLMEKVYEPYNLLAFPGGNTGNQMGGWFRKEIKSLDDLKGLKMRIPGFAGEVFAKVGVKPTNIPPGELYTALERNTIDAVEWVGPALDLRLGFQQIANYYYTGWHEPSTELQFLINKDVWESLPEDLQEILRVAMRTAAYDMLTQSVDANSKAWATIREKYPNVKVKSFPDDVFKAMYQANNEVLKEYAKDNELGQRIIKSRQDYLKKARAYTNISEKAYLDNMAELQD